MSEIVAVLGASPKSERYSNQAIRLLRDYGHTVLPVNPAQTEIEGLPVIAPLLPGLLHLKPKRVIFNPGSESPYLQEALEKAGIKAEEACTLVLLRTGQY